MPVILLHHPGQPPTVADLHAEPDGALLEPRPQRLDIQHLDEDDGEPDPGGWDAFVGTPDDD